MEALLSYLFLFCLCCTAGWCLEVVYRGFRHKKLVNPGFLRGCALPIYGTGGCILYFLSGLKLRFLPNEFWRVTVILLLAVLVMTLIELIGGAIALYGFHVRLWDYSGEWANFKGLICPKFSVFWGLICAGYYFFLYTPMRGIAVRVIEMPLLILGIGAYMGVFLVDLVHSLRLLQRVKQYAVQMRTHVNFEALKSSAYAYFQREGGRRSPFSFYGMISRYMFDKNGYREEIRRKWGEK